MVEERPGRCIEPRGHEDEHYCGKCGYCEEGSKGNIWTRLLREPPAIDEKPFHRNEAGSNTYKTISLRRSVPVPLLENRSGTRE